MYAETVAWAHEVNRWASSSLFALLYEGLLAVLVEEENGVFINCINEALCKEGKVQEKLVGWIKAPHQKHEAVMFQL